MAAALVFSWLLNLTGRVAPQGPLRRLARRFVLSSLSLGGRVVPRRALRSLFREWLADAVADSRIRTRVLAELSRTDVISVAQAGAALSRYSSNEWIGRIDVPTGR